MNTIGKAKTSSSRTRTACKDNVRPRGRMVGVMTAMGQSLSRVRKRCTREMVSTMTKKTSETDAAYPVACCS
jgi:hypothetical protein